MGRFLRYERSQKTHPRLCGDHWGVARFRHIHPLAKARPDWSIVMIGPVTSKHFSSVMAGVPNLHWLGEKGYDELPNYLKIFDVCLIPFKVDEFTEKIYPTKFHQYLGAGKPVVSSYLPDWSLSILG